MRHRSQRVGPIVIALGLLSGALVQADMLVLRDGTQISGLIEIRNNTVEFEPNRRGQSTMRVNRRDVRRIEFDNGGTTARRARAMTVRLTIDRGVLVAAAISAGSASAR